MIIQKPEEILIALGTDHRGFAAKQSLMQYECLPDGRKIIWHDVGTYSEERTDYPLFAQRAVALLVEKKVQYAILLCGSGIGMAIAANRVPHIYAGVVGNEDMARCAREDDNVNVLVFPADFITVEVMKQCLAVWLTATFKGGRYQERLEQIDR